MKEESVDCRRQMSAQWWLGVFLIACGTCSGRQINPCGREVIAIERVSGWDFAEGLSGWRAVNQAELSIERGILRICCTGADPYLHSPKVNVQGPVSVHLRMRAAAVGDGQIFWRTCESRQWPEEKSSRFRIRHDNQWHEYHIDLDSNEAIAQIRLDPGVGRGVVEVDQIEFVRTRLHPLEIAEIYSGSKSVQVILKNHSQDNIEIRVNGANCYIERGALKSIKLKTGDGPRFEPYVVLVESPGLSYVTRTVHLYRPDAETDWVQQRTGDLTVRAVRDGTGAEILLKDEVVATLNPLITSGNRVPDLAFAQSNGELVFRGEEVEVRLEAKDSEVSVEIDSRQECEGPVVRVLGGLEQGLFAGLEYLGKGEQSSSKLDIETEEHLRFELDLMKVTMPLMACVTEKAAVAITWDNMTVQPVFAAPNFFDGSDDHRMSLKAVRIRARILCRADAELGSLILWVVQQWGLPDLPPRPRSQHEQDKLCLKAFDGPLKGSGGWGHCAEDRWPRKPFADHASTIWRLTGKVPELPQIVLGGAHVPNIAIYFVTGGVDQWLKEVRERIQRTIDEQRSDGSFCYDGRFRRGHFEDTASGYCARRAVTLLEYAWVTGDKPALAAGLRTLKFMKRFRTPRGAQTWEVPLHTPDILASAYLVWAYVRGYELTDNTEYLTEARQWALSGVPFVYLWGKKPVMRYATVAVYGATEWRAPNWMGLPVQWCGLTYAYALELFSHYDKTIDWRKLSEGILIAAEQMQYAEGDSVGCLPDSWKLEAQKPNPSDINPCVLVNLRRRLDGKVDSVAVTTDSKYRVAAPFPVRLRDGKAIIEGQKGVHYQVLVNGENIIDLDSQGKDVVELRADELK